MLTEADLLKRIEQQAAELHQLRQRLKAVEAELALVPDKITTYKQALLREMAKAAVNCGSNYGCSLAARMIKD